MMMPLASQAALTAGVLGTLSLGLMRRTARASPCCALAIIAVVSAMSFALWMPGDVLSSPILLCDSMSLGWQYLICLGALASRAVARRRGRRHDRPVPGLHPRHVPARRGGESADAVYRSRVHVPARLPARRALAPAGARGLEAAVKYFFAGGVAGALFMLGLAMYYADTRSLAASTALSPARPGRRRFDGGGGALQARRLPLNWWLPDVYEAAAPEVSGFLSTAMKSAAVLFLMRLCELAPQARFAAYLPAVGALTALTGSVMALRQERLQRLLAYSSVSNAGLLIIGVGAWAPPGAPPTACAPSCSSSASTRS